MPCDGGSDCCKVMMSGLPVSTIVDCLQVCNQKKRLSGSISLGCLLISVGVSESMCHNFGVPDSHGIIIWDCHLVSCVGL